jgi:hypothetical protein
MIVLGFSSQSVRIVATVDPKCRSSMSISTQLLAIEDISQDSECRGHMTVKLKCCILILSRTEVILRGPCYKVLLILVSTIGHE